MMEVSPSSQRQRDTVTWFARSQLCSVITNGIIPEWFHGAISRNTAEELLMSKPPGYFLIRVSESRIGLTLSLRAEDRCRHFMIDVLEDGRYVVVGESVRHRLLQDLVDFHRRTPIMPFSEVLTVACGQATSDKTDYAELLFPQRYRSPNPLHPSTGHPVLQEVAQPAPPCRPYSWRDCMVPSAPSQANALYPRLDDDLSRVTSPAPVMPVPMTRRSYTTVNPPTIQPPEVPAHSSLNQPCIRTVSALDRPSPPMALHHSHGAHIRPKGNQEAKPSVVTNLKNLRKKFQKKRGTSQGHMYAEINLEASANAEHEYEAIAEEQTFHAPTFSYNCTEETAGGVPREYLPPPPFAPGY